MRIITANVNGIRSAAQKGFFNWQRRQNADVICLQEIRALPEQMPDEARAPRRYSAYFSPAERKGYSGVALYSRRPADRIITQLGWQEWDHEGRYLQADFGDLSIISLYIPSGSSGEARQEAKFGFLKRLMEHMTALRNDGRTYVITGDWNIAHKKIDLKNWRSNQKNSGFLPEERAWVDAVVDDLGWVDAFREVNDQPEQYTWWSNRGAAWDKNVGWRLDYQMVTPDLRDKIEAVYIYKTKRFSDHAPLTIDYSIDFPLA